MRPQLRAALAQRHTTGHAQAGLGFPVYRARLAPPLPPVGAGATAELAMLGIPSAAAPTVAARLVGGALRVCPALALPAGGFPASQHCILPIGVHIARYMKLLHLARNMHLARIARNMHDSVVCADCARHAPVMQNYDRFLALRAMCTSSKFTIVRNMRIVSKWAYCAPCALRYAHYMHICQNPPDRVCTRLGL